MKKVGIGIGIGLLLIAVAAAVVLLLVPAPPPPAPPPAVAEPEPEPEAEPEVAPEVVVTKLRGRVEARRGGKWVKATAGVVLAQDEAVRTGPGGEATLSVGDDKTQVFVRGRSEVSVREVTRKIARVRLERGRLSADLKGDVALKVESAGSSTVAETKKGRFSVFNNGKGLVAVAAETAEVKLRTSGGEQVVKAGKLATVERDEPATTEAIPEAVYLSVVWPEDLETRAKSYTVRGKANAGSQVLVNGKLVQVDRDGTFVAEVDLAEGKNPIEVKATDVLGRAKRTRRTMQVRRKGPKVAADSDGLWK